MLKLSKGFRGAQVGKPSFRCLHLFKASSSSPFSVSSSSWNRSHSHSNDTWRQGTTSSCFQKILHQTRRNSFERQNFSSSSSRSVIYAFGSGVNNAMGNGSKADGITPQKVRWDGYSQIIDIQAGWCSSFIVTENHDVYAWGVNTFGQLGIPEAKKDVFYPTLVGSLKGIPIIGASTGRAHSLFLSAHGEVFACGNYQFGQTGLGKVGGDKDFELIPQRIESLKGEEIVFIASGLDHNLAISKDGKVWTWGWNLDGQLGIITESSWLAEPKLLTELTEFPIVRACTGFDTNFLITEDAKLLGFGSPHTGLLGTKAKEDAVLIVIDEFDNKDVSFVSAAGSHVLVLAGQDLYSWGFTNEGQLGHGDDIKEQKPKHTPTIIETFRGKQIRTFTAGGSFSIVQTDDGNLYSFGFGNAGRLGHGNEQSLNVPKEIEFFKDKQVEMFSCGMDHSLVVVTEKIEH